MFLKRAVPPANDVYTILDSLVIQLTTLSFVFSNSFKLRGELTFDKII
jgi:hypothetical protein